MHTCGNCKLTKIANSTDHDQECLDVQADHGQHQSEVHDLSTL